MAASKAAKLQRQAQAFGLSPSEFRAMQKRRVEAESGLQDFPKAKRLELAARRLSITPQELKLLRSAYSVPEERHHSERVRSIARSIVALAPTTQPAQTKVGSPRTSPRPPAIAGPSATGSWKPDRVVYLTDWGDVVHIDQDCPGIWGFRSHNEPPPIIYSVTLRDRRCGGRRGCRKCIGGRWSNHVLQQLETQINNLHGNRRLTVSPSGRPTHPPVRSSGYRLPSTTAPSARLPDLAPRSKTIRISRSSPPETGSVLKWSGYSGKVSGQNERGVLIVAGGSRLTIPWGSTATVQDQ